MNTVSVQEASLDTVLKRSPLPHLDVSPPPPYESLPLSASSPPPSRFSFSVGRATFIFKSLYFWVESLQKGLVTSLYHLLYP